jgi:hypothetical protein
MNSGNLNSLNLSRESNSVAEGTLRKPWHTPVLEVAEASHAETGISGCFDHGHVIADTLS